MTTIGVILIIAAVFLVVAVLLQSSKEKGMSSALGGASSDTYYGKNKGNSRDYILNKLTIVVAIIFAILVIVSFVFQKEDVVPNHSREDLEGVASTTTTAPSGSTTVGDTTTPDTTTTATETSDPDNTTAG